MSAVCPPAAIQPPIRRAALAPGRVRRAAVVLASVCLLLLAQLLLVSHVHAGARAHGDDDGGPLCAVCLFKAAGHEQLGPTAAGGGLGLPLDAGSAAPAEPRQASPALGCIYRQPARGPPSATALT